MALNEDQLTLQKWVHDFAENSMRPIAEEWDEREEFPFPFVEEAAQIGLYGWEFMAELMMNDPTGLSMPVAIEELFWGDAGIGMAIMGSALAAAGISGNGQKELIEALKEKGCQFHNLTLQVGIGTFHPIQTDNILDHEMHKEWYEVSGNTLATLQDPASGPRVAVGTTSVRTIEDVLERIRNKPDGCITPSGSAQAEADIFIYPPFRFRGVDALITNFHLPESTLFMLVSALAGLNTMQQAYAHAIEHKYRFYSYGDSMLIFPKG